ncbi:MAG: HlyD family efflux transporter periplasmic adaptor subunit [Candidatus Limivicinus sp.]|nr:HlyD family efflux transporter periplasmic adaptor subunit [Clostridiales bacterium]MDY3859639.1 HlyD family efflux transporter periplasmic adaptor subunit [Candidatus Limivicinus sp.]
MEFKTANREWVKNAAIIFLAVLLVLTFFSNTIMNRSLMEVATARVSDGNIVAKVRGTGTVTASGKQQVKADKTRTIRSVMVKAGQEVKTGDILFILGEGDVDELEQAENTLRELQVSYQKAAISLPTFDYTALNRAVSDAEKSLYDAGAKLDEAQILYDEMRLKYADTSLEEQLRQALEQLQSAQDTLYAAQDAYNQRYQKAFDEVRACQEAYDNDPSEANAAALEAAQQKLSSMSEESDPLLVAARNQYDSAKAKYDALAKQQDDINYKLIPYQDELDKAQSEYDKAYDVYSDAESALYYAQMTNEKTLASAQIDLANLADQISRQQEKVKSLAGEDENTVTANVNGKIDTIDCTAGDTVAKGSLMCTIEVPDMGHTVSFSVTNDQAQRLRTGDTATVSNYYWGNTITATLTNIRTDPKNPQTNKLLTFDVTGDVTTGSELTLSVGQKSANYDLIVPNSAIRSDNNGSFVLAINQKSSPLGNRYIAKRVSIEVLASDDVNSAVVAELSNGDYVITTSSGPVKNGDQVRMADSSNG